MTEAGQPRRGLRTSRMSAPESAPLQWIEGSPRFCTTQWTVVLKAGGDGPQRAAALEQFCRMYWYPIYAFTRRFGTPPEDARDLTQDFFAHLLGKDWLAEVERRDTRFSTLLLTILKRFLANRHRDASALKRGGGAAPLSIDTVQAEQCFGDEPATDETPEKLFARRWALAVMEAALANLRAAAESAGKARHFALLHPFLEREAGRGEYEALEPELGLKPAGIALAVHRLRQHYREALREELGAGQVEASTVDEEMRFLAEALA